jgi:hypothetical protein
MSGADYAGHLLEVARRFRPGVRLAGAAAIPMARPSQLEGRLLAVLDPLRRRGELRRRTLFNAAIAVVALVVVLGCVSVRAEDAPADSTAARVAASATGQQQIIAPRLLVSGNEGTATDVRSAVQEPFRWRGEIPRGQTLEVRGVIGPIAATRASGSEAEVVAVRRAGDRGDPERIRLETIRHADGITICAVYPSRDRDRPNRCGPRGQGAESNRVENFDAEVHWTVRVPAGVKLRASTIAGDVRATGLASDVRAATVDGDIELATSGAASAATVDGDITARMGRVAGPLSFTTVDGDIDLSLPAGADAQISASTLDGELLADFPLDRRDGRWVGRSATATLGRGGPAVSLKTIDGDITLRSGRGSAVRARPTDRMGVATPATAPSAPRTPPSPRAAPLPPAVRVHPAPAVPPVAPVLPPAPPPSWETGFERGIAALVEGSVEMALRATEAALASVEIESLVAEATATASAEIDAERIAREAGDEVRRELARERERVRAEIRSELRRELHADSSATRP